MNPIDKVIFLLIKAGKPELCLSIMHLCPDIRRRGGFFQRRAEGKEQVYGGQDLVLGALVTTDLMHVQPRKRNADSPFIKFLFYIFLHIKKHILVILSFTKRPCV